MPVNFSLNTPPKNDYPNKEKKMTTNRKMKMFHHLYQGHSAISSIEKFNKKKMNFFRFFPPNICVELQCTRFCCIFFFVDTRALYLSMPRITKYRRAFTQNWQLIAFNEREMNIAVSITFSFLLLSCSCLCSLPNMCVNFRKTNRNTEIEEKENINVCLINVPTKPLH